MITIKYIFAVVCISALMVLVSFIIYDQVPRCRLSEMFARIGEVAMWILMVSCVALVVSLVGLGIWRSI